MLKGLQRTLLQMTRVVPLLGFGKRIPPVDALQVEELPVEPVQPPKLAEQRHDGAEDRERAEGRAPR
ncbi:MAG TPA: hypothetical protein VNN12_06950 [Dehalococcoidia bacterium]|nr:hypothetical protein [Dehalococcoidia bacterium]